MKHDITLSLKEAEDCIRNFYKEKGIIVDKINIENENKSLPENLVKMMKEVRPTTTKKTDKSLKKTAKNKSFLIDLERLQEELSGKDRNFEVTPDIKTRKALATGKLVNTAGIWNIEVGNDKTGKKHIPIDEESYIKIKEEGITERSNNIYVNFEYYPENNKILAKIKTINKHNA